LKLRRQLLATRSMN